MVTKKPFANSHQSKNMPHKNIVSHRLSVTLLIIHMLTVFSIQEVDDGGQIYLSTYTASVIRFVERISYLAIFIDFLIVLFSINFAWFNFVLVSEFSA